MNLWVCFCHMLICPQPQFTMINSLTTSCHFTILETLLYIIMFTVIMKYLLGNEEMTSFCVCPRRGRSFSEIWSKYSHFTIHPCYTLHDGGRCNCFVSTLSMPLLFIAGNFGLLRTVHSCIALVTQYTRYATKKFPYKSNSNQIWKSWKYFSCPALRRDTDVQDRTWYDCIRLIHLFGELFNWTSMP